MARTRIPDMQVLNTWDDVNSVLMEIAEAEIHLSEIEGEMNVRINDIKEAAEEASLPMKTRIADLGKQLKSFCEVNRPEFGNAKSKKLTFGDIGFRRSTSIVIKKGLEEKIIQNLCIMKMEDCIKTVQTVNKDVLGTYPEEQIVKTGASVKTCDTFWYETNKQILQP